MSGTMCPCPEGRYSEHSISSNFALFSSDIIEIAAESGTRKFYVHRGVLTAKSEQLRSVLAGAWREASEKRIDLSDWDGDTVGRFLQYAYVDDYQVHKPGPDIENPIVVSCHYRGRGDSGYEYEPYDCVCKDLFRSENTNVLLVHAKVYVLAQYKDIPKLQTLALDRAEEILLRIPLCLSSGTLEKTLADRLLHHILEVLKYINSNTCELSNSNEPLRDVFLSFLANNVRILGFKEWEGMWEFFRECSDLIVELLRKVMVKLADTEQKLDRELSSRSPAPNVQPALGWY